MTHPRRNAREGPHHALPWRFDSDCVPIRPARGIAESHNHANVMATDEPGKLSSECRSESRVSFASVRELRLFWPWKPRAQPLTAVRAHPSCTSQVSRHNSEYPSAIISNRAEVHGCQTLSCSSWTTSRTWCRASRTCCASTTASSAPRGPAKACRSCRAKTVHVVMTDQRMPEMTGVEFLKHVCATPSRDDPPAVHRLRRHQRGHRRHQPGQRLPLHHQAVGARRAQGDPPAGGRALRPAGRAQAAAARAAGEERGAGSGQRRSCARPTS